MAKSAQWWLGDWVMFGEQRYGEKHAQAIEATGYSYQTIANAKWIAGKFEFSERTENLTWYHHMNVAMPGRAIDGKVQETHDALFSLSLALSGDTKPSEPLRDAIERLQDVRAMGASDRKLKWAERALLAAPAQGPWDVLHKLYALTSAATVTKEIERHVCFEVMAALSAADALPPSQSRLN